MRATRRRPASRADLGWRGVTPKLSALEERELAVRIALGDTEARDRMVRANLGLVVVIAGRFAHLAMPLEDLVSEGNLGLIRAVETFDPGMGARFSTYASYWIKQAIRRGLMNQSDVVRRPVHAHKLLTRWRRASSALAQDLGREPSAEEVGAALGLGPRQLRLALEARRSSVQATSPGGHGEDGWWAIEGRDSDPAAAEADETLGRLRQGLEELGVSEAAVLRLRFGLSGEAPMTLDATGRRLGRSREGIRKAQVRALRKLSDAMAGD